MKTIEAKKYYIDLELSKPSSHDSAFRNATPEELYGIGSVILNQEQAESLEFNKNFNKLIPSNNEAITSINCQIGDRKIIIPSPFDPRKYDSFRRDILLTINGQLAKVPKHKIHTTQ